MREEKFPGGTSRRLHPAMDELFLSKMSKPKLTHRLAYHIVTYKNVHVERLQRILLLLVTPSLATLCVSAFQTLQNVASVDIHSKHCWKFRRMASTGCLDAHLNRLNRLMIFFSSAFIFRFCHRHLDPLQRGNRPKQSSMRKMCIVTR